MRIVIYDVPVSKILHHVYRDEKERYIRVGHDVGRIFFVFGRVVMICK